MAIWQGGTRLFTVFTLLSFYIITFKKLYYCIHMGNKDFYMNIQNLFFTAKRERGRNRNNPSQFFPCHQPLFTSLNIQNYVFLAEENYLESNFSVLFYARETKKEMKIIFTTSSLPTASIHIPLEDHAFICQRSVGFSTQQPDPSHRQHLPLRVCVSTSYLEITRGCSSVRTMSALKY